MTKSRALSYPPEKIVSEPINMLELNGSDVVYKTRWHYSNHDPYAVSIVFPASKIQPEVTTWIFARDLLADGLSRPTGMGDVQVWPQAIGRLGRRIVAIALHTKECDVLLEAPRSSADIFLSQTYRYVPRGREGEFAKVHTVHALARILSRGTNK